MKKDYYQILGLEKTATVDEIKKAYRKLAMQHHPDRNQGNKESEEKFKEVSEAYGVLSDERKRAQYDRFGTTGSSGMDGFNVDFDVGDIFESFFGGGFTSQRKKSTSRRGEDLEYEMHIDLKTSIYGGKEKISFTKYEDCATCNGEGGSGKTECGTCRGSGYVKYRQESFFGVIESSRACPDCEGSGETFSQLCSECNGKKRVRVQKDLDFEIPAGIDDGMIIKLTGEGNAGVGTKAKGDLYVKCRVELEEKGLKRDGDNLYYDFEVDVIEAILGTEKEINMPIIGKRKIKIPAGTQFDTVLKFQADGVKKLQSDSKGDLFITVKISIPKKLSKNEKKLYHDIAKEKKLEIHPDSGILGKIFH